MEEPLRRYMAPQDIYARHLISHRGYPLWIPEVKLQLPKDYQDHGINIGDVGYVVPGQGCFEVLFNIRLPLDHDLHRGKQLPRNFHPITLDEADIATYTDVEDAASVISTSSVTTVEVSPTEQPSDYNFTLASSEGALLILPQGADQHTLQRERLFGEHAKQHAVEWYRFVEEDLERNVSHDSLYLITGFYKSRSWALASFQESEGSGDIPARFKITQLEGGGIVRGYNWITTRHLNKRTGPKRYNGNANQAVYISGFKIAVRDEPVGWKKISVKAGDPSDQPCREEFTDTIDLKELDASTSDKSSESNRSSSMNKGAQRTSQHVSFQRIPEVSQPFHPSDVINRYLLHKEPSATVAITHDTQWAALLRSVRGRLEPHELGEEALVVESLSEKYVVTLEDGAVFLQSGKGASAGGTLKISRDSKQELRATVRPQTQPKPSGTLQPGAQRPPPPNVNGMANVPPADSKIVNSSFAVDNVQPPPPKLLPPTQEQVQSAIGTIQQLKSAFQQRLPGMATQQIPDDQRAEYARLLDLVHKMTLHIDTRLHMYFVVSKSEELLRKYVAIVLTVGRQWDLANSSPPQYIISLPTLKTVLGQIHMLNQEFENRWRVMKTAGAANQHLASLNSGRLNPGATLTVPPPIHNIPQTTLIASGSGRQAPLNPPPSHHHSQPPPSQYIPSPHPALSHPRPNQTHPYSQPHPPQPPSRPIKRSPPPRPSNPPPPSTIALLPTPANSPSFPKPTPSKATAKKPPPPSPPNLPPPSTIALLPTPDSPPHSPKPTPSKATAKKGATRATRQPSTPRKAPATPETVPSPVAGIKRPPEDDVTALTTVAHSEAEASNALSPKKIKIEWDSGSNEGLVKRHQGVENIEEEEEAAAFFDRMKALFDMSATMDNDISHDISPN